MGPLRIVGVSEGENKRSIVLDFSMIQDEEFLFEHFVYPWQAIYLITVTEGKVGQGKTSRSLTDI